MFHSLKDVLKNLWGRDVNLSRVWGCELQLITILIIVNCYY